MPTTPSVTYDYGSSVEAHDNGRLIKIADGTGEETFAYNPAGRVRRVAKTLLGLSFPVEYTYNLAGAISSISYPSGRQVTHTYDAIGRIESIGSDSTVLWSLPTFTTSQQLSAFTLGNGVSASLGYSTDRLLLTSLGYAKAGVTLAAYTFGYAHPSGGNNGKITQVYDAVTPGRSTTFGFDALNRLASAETSGSAAYPRWKLSYTYDRYGNRLTQTAVEGSAPTKSLAFSPSTNRITTTGYNYDLSGNLWLTPEAVHTFDAVHQLVERESTGTDVFAYDGRGLLLTRSGDGGNRIFIHSGTQVIAEYDLNNPSGPPIREYTYAGNQLLTSHQTGSLSYYLSDGSSLRAVTSATGSLTAQQGHFPFGETWYFESGGSDRVFNSYRRDVASGLDYATFRHFAPPLGRFVQPDPLEGSIYNPQSLNRYAYGYNDPVNNLDPFGLSTIEKKKDDDTQGILDLGLTESVIAWAIGPQYYGGFGGGTRRGSHGKAGDKTQRDAGQGDPIWAQLYRSRAFLFEVFCLLQQYAQLSAFAQGGSSSEPASFIVQGPNGFSFQRAPTTGGGHSNEMGPAPSGTVGTIHVHPNNSVGGGWPSLVSPRNHPGKSDASTANTTGAGFVVSRSSAASGIFVVLPAQGGSQLSMQLYEGSSWSKGFSAKDCP